MRTWQIDNQTIYEIEPLREYLRALAVPTLRETQEQRLMLVIGEAGVGKTVGAQIFQQESVSSCAYIALPSEQLLQPRDIVDLVAKALYISPAEFRGRLELATHIIESSHRHPWTVLLDGAQSLRRYQWLDLIRWLHDESAHTFVLIGTPSLEYAFLAHPEFSSRVLLRHQVRLPTAAEIAPLFKGFPAEAIAQVYADTRGVMRQVMVLRHWLVEFMAKGNFAEGDLAPKQVKRIARTFLLRAV